MLAEMAKPSVSDKSRALSGNASAWIHVSS